MVGVKKKKKNFIVFAKEPNLWDGHGRSWKVFPYDSRCSPTYLFLSLLPANGLPMVPATEKVPPLAGEYPPPVIDTDFCFPFHHGTRGATPGRNHECPVPPDVPFRLRRSLVPTSTSSPRGNTRLIVRCRSRTTNSWVCASRQAVSHTAHSLCVTHKPTPPPLHPGKTRHRMRHARPAHAAPSNPQPYRWMRRWPRLHMYCTLSHRHGRGLAAGGEKGPACFPLVPLPAGTFHISLPQRAKLGNTAHALPPPGRPGE